MSGTQISAMTPLAVLPDTGAVVPVVKTGEATNYAYDIAAKTAQQDAATQQVTDGLATANQEIAKRAYTAETLAALKAAPVTNGSYILLTPSGPVTYAYVSGNFTATADDKDVVALNGVPLTTGALKRTSAAEVVSLRDYVRFVTLNADGKPDWTTAWASAIADLEANPRGGKLTIPMGIFRGAFSLMKQVPDFEKRITVEGAGRGATQLWPNGSGAIILNMVGRNTATVRSLSLVAGDEYQAYAGIVLARTTTSDNCNNNKFRDLEVQGNYGKATLVSIAAESAEWHNCRFRPGGGSSGIAAIWGSDTNAPNVQLVVPGVTNLTPRNANTDIRVTNCEFYNDQVGDAHTVILSAGHSIHFDRCGWIAAARSHVHFCDPVGSIMGGGTEFDGCHFEGQIGSRYSVDTGGAAVFLKGIVDRNSVDVTEGGSFLDYDRSNPSSVLVLQQCEFRPGAPLSQTRTGINLGCDIADRSVIDWSNMGPDHSVVIYSIASRSDVTAATLRCWQQSDSRICYLTSARVTAPSTGTYPKGHFVVNAGSSGVNDTMPIGGVAGWITQSAGSVDPDPGSMTINVTSGSVQATVPTNYGFYEGQRLFIQDVGAVVLRAVSGNGLTLILNNPAGVTGTKNVNIYGAVFGRFTPLGIIGAIQAASFTLPTGGTTVDAEARTAIGQIRTALVNAKLMAGS